MPDPIPTPPPEPAKPKRSHGPVNKEYLDEMVDARQVAAAALDPDHVAALAAVEFDDALPGQITTLADQIDPVVAQLLGKRATKKQMTAEEKTARDILLDIIQPIQSAARRKYQGRAAAQRDAYFMGVKLPGQSLSEVMGAAKAILARLAGGPNNAPPQDVLPGIAPDGKIRELRDAIATYDNKNTAQGDRQSEAEITLGNLDGKIKDLAEMRWQIQLTADQAWPARNRANAPIRKAFLLPPNRPLTK